MKALDQIYNDWYFKQRFSLKWRVPIVCSAIIDILSPKSIIDVGCATGQLINEFQKRGIIAFGIEGSKTALPYVEPEALIIVHDLREPWPHKMPSAFDLAMSLEVAEHIEPEYSAEYITTLTTLSDRILISAAPPGQRGTYHVNCQTKEYWIKTFELKGYLNKPDIENQFRAKWEPWANVNGINSYYRNLLYFERGL